MSTRSRLANDSFREYKGIVARRTREARMTPPDLEH
jgi:hypothetical protein